MEIFSLSQQKCSRLFTPCIKKKKKMRFLLGGTLFEIFFISRPPRSSSRPLNHFKNCHKTPIRIVFRPRRLQYKLKYPIRTKPKPSSTFAYTGGVKHFIVIFEKLAFVASSFFIFVYLVFFF